MKILAIILILAAPVFAGDIQPVNPFNLPWDQDAPKIYDSDGNFKGNLSPDPYDPDSINNPHGVYGSPYQPDSVNFGNHPQKESWGERVVQDIIWEN